MKLRKSHWIKCFVLLQVFGGPFALAHPPYETGLGALVSGFEAKMVCSCLFVSGMEEDACRRLVKLTPAEARLTIDLVKKSVVSSYIGGSRKAFFVNDAFGCKLDPPSEAAESKSQLSK